MLIVPWSPGVDKRFLWLCENVKLLFSSVFHFKSKIITCANIIIYPIHKMQQYIVRSYTVCEMFRQETGMLYVTD